MNSSTPLLPVVALIFDPIGATSVSVVGGTGQRVLEQLTDYPDQVNRAVVGYDYPKAQREFSLSCGTVSPGVPLVNYTGGGVNSVVYFHIQWRNTQNIAPALASASGEDFVPATALPAYSWFK